MMHNVCSQKSHNLIVLGDFTVLLCENRVENEESMFTNCLRIYFLPCLQSQFGQTVQVFASLPIIIHSLFSVIPRFFIDVPQKLMFLLWNTSSVICLAIRLIEYHEKLLICISNESDEFYFFRHLLSVKPTNLATICTVRRGNKTNFKLIVIFDHFEKSSSLAKVGNLPTLARCQKGFNIFQLGEAKQTSQTDRRQY